MLDFEEVETSETCFFATGVERLSAAAARVAAVISAARRDAGRVQGVIRGVSAARTDARVAGRDAAPPWRLAHSVVLVVWCDEGRTLPA